MGRVEFQQWLAAEADKDGLAELRSALVDALRGDILEVGAGSGAMFAYYGEGVSVTAIEPDDEFRAGAEEAARAADVGALAAQQVLKILRDGAEPGDLPIARVTDFAYVVNMDVANKLGMYPPIELLQIAEIVE